MTNLRRELAKKLKAKFGSAPDLGSRFDAGAAAQSSSSSGEAPPPRKKSRRSLQTVTTEEIIAELMERGGQGDDDLAQALAEAAAEFEASSKEEELEEDFLVDEEEEGLPEYRPPRNAAFAERVVIIGGGPAGLAAAVYASRAGLAPVVVAPPGGGQLLGKGVTIENYPGVEGETGPSLVVRMQKHAADYGAAFYPYRVTRAHLSQGSPFVLETDSGANITAHTVIVSTGADSRWLGVAGEDDYKGAGVSSCATCDGFVYRDKEVAVIGGGDTAMEDALVLARTSSKVTVVHRRDSFRASKAMADRVLQHPKISVWWNGTVDEFVGAVDEEDDGDYEYDDDDDEPPPAPTLTKLVVRDVSTGTRSDLPVSGAFVAIGHDPNTWLFADQLARESNGYLKLRGGKFATELTVDGVFAAGDVADSIYRQAITSAGSGAQAALDAERWLSEMGIGDDDGVDDLMAEIREAAVDSGINIYDDADADILKHANSEL